MLNIYKLYCHNYVVFLVVPIKSNWNSCLKILIIPFECNMQPMTPKLPNLHFLRNWRKMQATNTNPIHYIKKKTSQRSSKLVTVLEVNVQTCISTAIWVYLFFFFFVLPVLKAGMNLFLLLENFMYMNQPYLKYLKAMHLSGHDYLLDFSVLCRKPKQCQI